MTFFAMKRLAFFDTKPYDRLTKVRHLTIMVSFENETEPRTSSFAGA